jgi:hypothetical protein
VETDGEYADLKATIVGLLEGQFSNPIRVIAFNTAERWSEDVSEDIAHELRRRCDLQFRDVPSTIQDFVERYEGHRQLAPWLSNERSPQRSALKATYGGFIECAIPSFEAYGKIHEKAATRVRSRRGRRLPGADRLYRKRGYLGDLPNAGLRAHEETEVPSVAKEEDEGLMELQPQGAPPIPLRRRSSDVKSP